MSRAPVPRDEQQPVYMHIGQHVLGFLSPTFMNNRGYYFGIPQLLTWAAVLGIDITFTPT
ncbi:hypothetical protein ACFXO9_02320 [Nocardia tengchongensis]|uniref:hypothetical protein n=1 Tax=Nocardia tengchongensis TaxID=2055889 RepID=UPI0036A1884F